MKEIIREAMNAGVELQRTHSSGMMDALQVNEMMFGGNS